MKNFLRPLQSVVHLNILHLFLLVTVPTALSGAFLIAGASSVYAASAWSVLSEGTCKTPSVNGHSALLWENQGSSANGYTNGKLWIVLSGNNYQLRNEQGSNVTGNSRIAEVFPSYGPGQSGQLWDETGAHSASFFSPPRYTGAGTFRCP